MDPGVVIGVSVSTALLIILLLVIGYKYFRKAPKKFADSSAEDSEQLLVNQKRRWGRSPERRRSVTFETNDLEDNESPSANTRIPLYAQGHRDQRKAREMNNIIGPDYRQHSVTHWLQHSGASQLDRAGSRVSVHDINTFIEHSNHKGLDKYRSHEPTRFNSGEPAHDSQYSSQHQAEARYSKHVRHDPRNDIENDYRTRKSSMTVKQKVESVKRHSGYANYPGAKIIVKSQPSPTKETNEIYASISKDPSQGNGHSNNITGNSGHGRTRLLVRESEQKPIFQRNVHSCASTASPRNSVFEPTVKTHVKSHAQDIETDQSTIPESQLSTDSATYPYTRQKRDEGHEKQHGLEYEMDPRLSKNFQMPRPPATPKQTVEVLDPVQQPRRVTTIKTKRSGESATTRVHKEPPHTSRNSTRLDTGRDTPKRNDSERWKHAIYDNNVGVINQIDETHTPQERIIVTRTAQHQLGEQRQTAPQQLGEQRQTAPQQLGEQRQTAPQQLGEQRQTNNHVHTSSSTVYNQIPSFERRMSKKYEKQKTQQQEATETRVEKTDVTAPSHSNTPLLASRRRMPSLRLPKTSDESQRLRTVDGNVSSPSPFKSPTKTHNTTFGIQEQRGVYDPEDTTGTQFTIPVPTPMPSSPTKVSNPMSSLQHRRERKSASAFDQKMSPQPFPSRKQGTDIVLDSFAQDDHYIVAEKPEVKPSIPIPPPPPPLPSSMKQNDQKKYVGPDKMTIQTCDAVLKTEKSQTHTYRSPSQVKMQSDLRIPNGNAGTAGIDTMSFSATRQKQSPMSSTSVYSPVSSPTPYKSPTSNAATPRNKQSMAVYKPRDLDHDVCEPLCETPNQTAIPTPPPPPPLPHQKSPTSSWKDRKLGYSPATSPKDQGPDNMVIPTPPPPPPLPAPMRYQKPYRHKKQDVHSVVAPSQQPPPPPPPPPPLPITLMTSPYAHQNSKVSSINQSLPPPPEEISTPDLQADVDYNQQEQVLSGDSVQKELIHGSKYMTKLIDFTLSESNFLPEETSTPQQSETNVTNHQSCDSRQIKDRSDNSSLYSLIRLRREKVAFSDTLMDSVAFETDDDDTNMNGSSISPIRVALRIENTCTVKTSEQKSIKSRQNSIDQSLDNELTAKIAKARTIRTDPEIDAMLANIQARRKSSD